MTGTLTLVFRIRNLWSNTRREASTILGNNILTRVTLVSTRTTATACTLNVTKGTISPQLNIGQIGRTGTLVVQNHFILGTAGGTGTCGCLNTLTGDTLRFKGS